MPVRHSGSRGFGAAPGAARAATWCARRATSSTLRATPGTSPGFVEIGRRFRPDIALLPIAGYEPAGFREEHMSPLDAVYAFEDLGARVMIPTSYGSFPLSYEPLEAPLEWLQEIMRARVAAVRRAGPARRARRLRRHPGSRREHPLRQAGRAGRAIPCPSEVTVMRARQLAFGLASVVASLGGLACNSGALPSDDMVILPTRSPARPRAGTSFTISACMGPIPQGLNARDGKLYVFCRWSRHHLHAGSRRRADGADVPKWRATPGSAARPSITVTGAVG